MSGIGTPKQHRWVFFMQKLYLPGAYTENEFSLLHSPQPSTLINTKHIYFKDTINIRTFIIIYLQKYRTIKL